jgi:hypothetical protein
LNVPNANVLITAARKIKRRNRKELKLKNIVLSAGSTCLIKNLKNKNNFGDYVGL